MSPTTHSSRRTAPQLYIMLGQVVREVVYPGWCIQGVRVWSGLAVPVLVWPYPYWSGRTRTGLGLGSWSLDLVPGPWILDLDPGPWILDLGLITWTLAS